jgi:hypothetical protein
MIDLDARRRPFHSRHPKLKECLVPDFTELDAAHGQRNTLSYYKYFAWLYPVLRLVLPNQVSTLRDVGLAMIHSTLREYPKQILEIRDINALAKE